MPGLLSKRIHAPCSSSETSRREKGGRTVTGFEVARVGLEPASYSSALEYWSPSESANGLAEGLVHRV